MGIFDQKTAPSNSLVQLFLWKNRKNRKNRIVEALFQQDNDIVQMREMAHSICLIKLYRITMRKKFRFFVSDYLKSVKVFLGHPILRAIFRSWDTHAFEVVYNCNSFCQIVIRVCVGRHQLGLDAKSFSLFCPKVKILIHFWSRLAYF